MLSILWLKTCIIHVNLVTVGLLMFKDNCLNVSHDMLGGGGGRGEDEREKREARDREFQNNH